MFRPRSNRYVRIDNEADDAGELLLNRQFEMPERPFPKKEIILGIGMLLLGVALITLGILIHVEQWDNDVPGVDCLSTGRRECTGSPRCIRYFLPSPCKILLQDQPRLISA